MRRLALFAILSSALLSVHAPVAQDVAKQDLAETEPNDDSSAENLQRVGLGVTMRGEISSGDDQDWYTFETTRDCVCDVEVSAKGSQPVRFQMPGSYPGNDLVPGNGKFEMVALRLSKGLHPFCVAADAFETPQSYAVLFRPVNPAANEETEPNGDGDNALPLELGKASRGMKSYPGNDHDCYVAEIAKGGIYRLSFTHQAARKDNRAQAFITLSRVDAKGELSLENSYRYRCDLAVLDFVFYPALDPGRQLFEIEMPEGVVRDAYEILLEPVSPKLTTEDEKRARAAIAKGVEFLNTSQAHRTQWGYSVAAEGAALAALCDEPEFDKRKTNLERDFLKFFEGFLENGESSTYKGEKAWRLSSIYDHALATIALAEASGKGSEASRRLCESCVKHILGAQLSSRREAACGGPMSEDSAHYGGWRYYPNSQEADLSITGWCLVALLAADAAGIKLEGTRAAVRDAQAFVERCYDAHGWYTYQPGSLEGGNIRNSVGVLTLLLLGVDQEDARVVKPIEDLDRHLPAGTQVDVGHNECFYYWYYATRVNYLRGDKAWENWRALMVDQLLRRQQADGAWDALNENETGAGPRYSTGIAVIILRLCLNEAPKYLRPEGRGF